MWILKELFVWIFTKLIQTDKGVIMCTQNPEFSKVWKLVKISISHQSGTRCYRGAYRSGCDCYGCRVLYLNLVPKSSFDTAWWRADITLWPEAAYTSRLLIVQADHSAYWYGDREVGYNKTLIDSFWVQVSRTMDVVPLCSGESSWINISMA